MRKEKMAEEENVRALFKVLASSEDLLLILPRTTTVADVKIDVETYHSRKPSAKHLSVMFRGRILSDELTLSSVLADVPLPAPNSA